MSASLEQRARRMRSRAQIRAWEYRQRNHAKGVWFRLRRVLVDAASAYAVPDAELRQLLAEGLVPAPVGSELSPPKTIVFAPAERVQQIEGRREVPLRLGAELLRETSLVLVAHPPYRVPPSRR